MNKLYLVGIGPGAYEKMTIEADRALQSCQVIAGYTVYVDLIKDYYPGKEWITTPMRQEKERCLQALRSAQEGKTTAVVCSGDPVIYGMAGLVYELGHAFPEVEVEVIPGATAALSGSALLGAPLTHDFCVISLSDLLTEWDLIEERLRCAAKGDFVICLYNPASKKRADYLKRACDILLETRPGSTVCAIAENIGRPGERTEITDLQRLRDREVNMFTTVFIGNRQTKVIAGKMVTPRGYKDV